MKIILITIVLFFAIGVAMVLLMRLQQLQQKLAQLYDELAQNDRRMMHQRLEVEKLALEKENQPQGHKDTEI